MARIVLCARLRMIQFFAVVALLVFAAIPAIARDVARRKLRQELQIELATSHDEALVSDAPPLPAAARRS